MSDELKAAAIIIAGNCVLAGLALFGGDCFNLALTRESRGVLRRRYPRSGVFFNAS